MTSAILLVVFVLAVTGLGYMMLFGFDRMLKSHLKSSLHPGESIAFESPTARGGAGFTFMFSFREGYLIVTNLRLLIAWWVFPPLWKTVHSTQIRDIDSIATVNMLAIPQFQITTSTKKYMVMPRRNRFWPFSKSFGDGFLTALRAGESARFTETHGLKNMARSQVERKQ